MHELLCVKHKMCEQLKVSRSSATRSRNVSWFLGLTIEEEHHHENKNGVEKEHCREGKRTR
jgi:hypothetical protein